MQQAISAVAPIITDWQHDGPTIPTAQWTRAVSAVDQIVRGYGFNSGPSAVPNRQYVAFYDQYGGELSIASDKKTGLLLMSGCHLTAAAKRRGHPTPRPTY